jgi:hypothetical protein
VTAIIASIGGDHSCHLLPLVLDFRFDPRARSGGLTHLAPLRRSDHLQRSPYGLLEQGSQQYRSPPQTPRHGVAQACVDSARRLPWRSSVRVDSGRRVPWRSSARVEFGTSRGDSRVAAVAVKRGTRPGPAAHRSQTGGVLTPLRFCCAGWALTRDRELSGERPRTPI